MAGDSSATAVWQPAVGPAIRFGDSRGAHSARSFLSRYFGIFGQSGCGSRVFIGDLVLAHELLKDRDACDSCAAVCRVDAVFLL